MLSRILGFSIDNRWLVVFATLVTAVVGAEALSRLPIDAVPDITNKQVQINALAPAFAPTDMERQVTFPIETALAGVPGLTSTRSLTRNGFCQVTAIFDDAVLITHARTLVNERLAEIRTSLPPDVDVRLGPMATGLGEVHMWSVEYAEPKVTQADGAPGWQQDGSFRTPEGQILRTDLERLTYLRTVQDWLVRPQIRAVAGVAGVDAIGGYVKQLVVEPMPSRLAARGLSFTDLIAALEANNLSSGAGTIEVNGEGRTVRLQGRVASPEDLESIAIGSWDGSPVHVRDVARVVVGGEVRAGSASRQGSEVVIGTAIMRVGENSRAVAKAVEAKMAEVRRTLPPGIAAPTVLDRTKLVDATIATVRKNLVEGALFVVVVLLVLLRHFRAALVAALAIPLSFLLTAWGMVRSDVSGNLMSLGALDFGLVVDGAVIIVENCLRRLSEHQHALGRTLTRAERLAIVREATGEVRGATAFGEAIIVTVYVPILALTGVEGRMFHPMAWTVIFALAAAMVLSLTFVPAAVAISFSGHITEKESPVLHWARRLYAPLLHASLRYRSAVAAGAALSFVFALAVFLGLGREFVPTLDEHDVAMHAMRVPSTGIDQSTRMQLQIEKAVANVPEVAFIFSKTGTAEVAADPMPPNVSDTFVLLKPRDQWPDPAADKGAVLKKLEAAASLQPGHAFEFTQPIQMRFNELLAGVRGDVAVKLYADDIEAALPTAQRIALALQGVRGAADVKVEQVAGLPQLTIDVDRAALSRLGLNVEDVEAVVSAAVGGRPAGLLFEGDRRFDVVVRLPEAQRMDLEALRNLPIPLPLRAEPDRLAGTRQDTAQAHAELRSVPLSSVARLDIGEGMNQISRENGRRRVVIQCNVRNRDIGSFVEEAKTKVAAVSLPPGSWLDWGGQFENLIAAEERLSVVVPICFLVIFFLLYVSFRSIADALLVFTGVPFGATGGVLALWLRDLPFSISAGVGFIALSGVAVLNGLVMIGFVRQLLAQGMPLDLAIVRAADTRLRPVLMTALVASLGFLPMAMASGQGAEVQRPLATVVIGGLVSSTLLTLLVLPALYRMVHAGRGVEAPGPATAPQAADG